MPRRMLLNANDALDKANAEYLADIERNLKEKAKAKADANEKKFGNSLIKESKQRKGCRQSRL
jgi:hypothetical protein